MEVVDFTQWWVPAVTMVVLGTYVLISGFRESRLPMPTVAAVAEGDGEAIAAEAVVEPAENKRGFLARTSWIWGSILIGAAAQAYLSFVPA